MNILVKKKSYLSLESRDCDGIKRETIVLILQGLGLLA